MYQQLLNYIIGWKEKGKRDKEEGKLRRKEEKQGRESSIG